MKTQETIRILLVEDDPGARSLVERVLRRNSGCSYNIMAAPNLAQARQLLRENRFDNVLLDLGLPDSNGTDTLRKIRDIDPHVSIVVISGYEDSETSIQAMKLGADYYIVKNTGMSESLAPSISKAVAKRSAIPAKAAELQMQHLRVKLQSAEQLLSKTRTEFITIFDSVPAAIWYRDREGRILRANKTAAESVGMKVTDLVGRNYYEIFSSAAQTSRKKDLTVIESGEPLFGDIRCFKNHLDQTRYALVDRIPFTDQSGRVAGVIVFALDITERKLSDDNLARAKTELEKLNAKLAESACRAHDLARKAQQANETKSNFLASVTHEIRTPMNSILGFADLLAEECLTTNQQHCVQMISTAANSLLDLVNDLLDFSKIEAGKLDVEIGPAAPQKILRHVYNLLKPQADAKGIDLQLDCSPHLSNTIETDASRLKQCLINLVGNAVKFTEAGHVRICADYVTVNGTAKVAIAVTDTGIGIPADKQETIFDAFSQAEVSTFRKYGGTGLGLAVTAKLVDMLAGSIQLQSAPDEGSTFTIYLPIKYPGSLGDTQLADDSAHMPAKKMTHKALVLTTSSHVSMILTTAIRHTALSPHVIDSREQLTAILRNEKPALMIIDSAVTGGPLNELTNHGIPTIFITNADTGDLSDGHENIRTLAKPLTRRAIQNAVSDLLKSEELSESSDQTPAKTSARASADFNREFQPLLQKIKAISDALNQAVQRDDWQFVGKVSQLLGDIAQTSRMDFFKELAASLHNAVAAKQPAKVRQLAQRLSQFCCDTANK